MGSFAVIEDLDVIEDFTSGLVLVDETAVVGEFVLQVGEKAFHNSVIPRIALAAHGGGDPFAARLAKKAEALSAISSGSGPKLCVKDWIGKASNGRSGVRSNGMVLPYVGDVATSTIVHRVTARGGPSH